VHANVSEVHEAVFDHLPNECPCGTQSLHAHEHNRQICEEIRCMPTSVKFHWPKMGILIKIMYTVSKASYYEFASCAYRCPWPPRMRPHKSSTRRPGVKDVRNARNYAQVLPYRSPEQQRRLDRLPPGRERQRVRNGLRLSNSQSAKTNL